MEIELLSLEDVCEKLGRKKATINSWIHYGKEIGPNFFKVGGKQMITVDDFNSYISKCKGAK
jgi:hypothetical protein